MQTPDLISAVALGRVEHGLSLRKLSEQIGVSFTTLARIERGDGAPSLSTRIALLEWLGLDATTEREQLMRQSPDFSLRSRVGNLEFLVETLVEALRDLQAEVRTLQGGTGT